MRWIRIAPAVALVLAACAPALDTGFPPSSPTPEETGESPEPTATGTVDLTGPIDVIDNAFEAKVVRVEVGGTVEWSQSGTQPHTVTASDGSFDSHPDCSFPESDRCLNAGDTYEQAFDAPGEIPYYCKLHGTAAGGGMAGTIIVEA